jgi:hypothetical protein
MRWDSVDLTAGVICYRQEANAEVEIPMHASLATHLDKLASSDQPERHLYDIEGPAARMGSLKCSGHHARRS